VAADTRCEQKLQRRIANFRGLAPDAALVSPSQISIEDPRLDAQKPEPSVADHRDSTNGIVAKRKYRRHPKVGGSERNGT